VPLGVLGLSLVEGLASWLAYSYAVVDGELRIERGFLVRQRIMIPADRVQAIDVSQGLVQRLFGLVKVEVKTAGGTQGTMSAITRESADHLRQVLSRTRAGTVEPNTGVVEHVRYALSLKQLLLAASTSGRLGVLLSGMLWLYSQIDDLIEERLLEALASLDIESSLAETSPWFVAALIALGVLVAFVASVVAEMARFGGFSVVRTGNQLVISRGLFERRQVTVQLERIQAIRIIEGLLRQPLGYAALMVETAGHADERGKSTELHPFLHQRQWQVLLEHLTPPHAVSPELMRPPPRALPRFLLRPTLIALAPAAALTLAVPLGWLSLILVALAPWLGWLAYRDAAAGIQGQTLLLRRRGLRRVTAMVQRRHIQFTEHKRSLMQRRRRLATFSVAVASGTGGKLFSVPDLDAQVVEGLASWCRGGPAPSDKSA
jgi:putative membrane protein